MSKKSKHKESLKVRVVRILLSWGEYEYLLTNTHFTLGQLSELYHLRWGVETRYGFLKENLQLENFSSKTTQGVLQDFHACILTSNLAQLVIKEAELELVEKERRASKKEKIPKSKQGETRKYGYQINQNVALGILRNRLPDLLLKPQELPENLARLKAKIKRHTLPIVPNRGFERKKQKRSKRKFFFPKKRPF
ncbi:MAG: transposase [Bacteroidota bacterium]